MPTFFLAAALSAAVGGPGGARAADGAAVFTQNCALCHQSDAAGLAGQYPRLSGRLGRIAGNPKGRAYLIDVITYGMTGEITVDKQSIIGGVMPSLQLTDDDAASVLSFLVTMGDTPAREFTPEEVRARRAKSHQSSADVHAERRSLLSAKIIK